MQEQEFVLGHKSRDYNKHLQVRSFDLRELRAALLRVSQRAAFLEIREYYPFDFRKGERGEEPHWAGLLMHADGSTRVFDLGLVAATQAAVQVLIQDIEGEAGQRAAHNLYRQLF